MTTIRHICPYQCVREWNTETEVNKGVDIDNDIGLSRFKTVNRNKIPTGKPVVLCLRPKRNIRIINDNNMNDNNISKDEKCDSKMTRGRCKAWEFSADDYTPVVLRPENLLEFREKFGKERLDLALEVISKEITLEDVDGIVEMLEKHFYTCNIDR